MTLHFSAVFGLLVAEMALFTFLLLPMPHSVRKPLMAWISRSRLVQQVLYFLRFAYGFILMLFVDAVRTAWRMEAVAASGLREFDASSGVGHASMPSERGSAMQQLKLFRAQRNMYLCGFTLFLSLLLNRFISMIQTMVELQSRSEKQEGSLNADEGDMTPSDPHQPAILTETQKLRQRATHERNRSRSAEPKKIK